MAKKERVYMQILLSPAFFYSTDDDYKTGGCPPLYYMAIS